MKLYLASASPIRRKLLEILGIPHIIAPSDIDESEVMNSGTNPALIVKELAKRKAEYVKNSLSEPAIVVGCDTVCYRHGKVFGKPKDNDEARSMLELLLNYSDTQHTGICVFDPNNKKPVVNSVSAEFIFSGFDSKDIEQYVKSGEPLKNAGAFNPQGKFARTFGIVKKGYSHSDFAFPFEFLLPSLKRYNLLPDLGVKRITLCSSASFFDRLPGINDELSKRGYEVLLPSMMDYHGMEEDSLTKIQFDLMRAHSKKIDRSDAVYVANFEKKGIPGYIGGNTFLEMGKAFDKNIPIFLREEIPSNIGYREELLAMKPVVIGEDWDKIKRILDNN